MTTILQKIMGAINALQLTLFGNDWAIPVGGCLLNVIAANPLRTLPFALLLSKNKPDKKCF